MTPETPFATVRDPAGAPPAAREDPCAPCPGALRQRAPLDARARLHRLGPPALGRGGRAPPLRSTREWILTRGEGVSYLAFEYDTSTYVGCVDLRSVDFGVPRCQIGFVGCSRQRGRGLVREAALTLMDWAWRGAWPASRSGAMCATPVRWPSPSTGHAARGPDAPGRARRPRPAVRSPSAGAPGRRSGAGSAAYNARAPGPCRFRSGRGLNSSSSAHRPTAMPVSLSARIPRICTRSPACGSASPWPACARPTA